MSMTDHNKSRTWIIQGLIAVVFLVFIIRLLVLQVIDKDYAELAKDRSVRKVTIYPDRGQIFDRNGKLIVHNKPIYNLMVIPSQVHDLDTLKFCDMLGIDRAYLRRRWAKPTGIHRYMPVFFNRRLRGKILPEWKNTCISFMDFFRKSEQFAVIPIPVQRTCWVM
jgi:penicillin-binding protein 2